MLRREHALLQPVTPDEVDRDEVARRAAVDEAARRVPVHRRVDAEEYASVNTGRGVGVGVDVEVPRREWRRARATLRQERAELVLVHADACSDGRRLGHRRDGAHASALRRGSDAARVERLRGAVGVDAGLHAIEADGAVWWWRRRLDVASGGCGVGDGLGERCEWIAVRSGAMRCCRTVRCLLLFALRCVVLRCCWWLSGCAGMPVRYRAVAIDGTALSRTRAEWPGRAA